MSGAARRAGCRTCPECACYLYPQSAVRALSSRRVLKKIVRAGERAEAAERGSNAELPSEAYAVHTGSKPISMYTPDLWARCFPKCFPYGDGVFGLPRATSLTFQQWASMLLLREELCYDVSAAAKAEAQAWFESEGSPTASAAPPGPQRSTCHCVQCAAACQPFSAPKQPRWGHDRELLCCLYDSWRRMEQVHQKNTNTLRLQIQCRAPYM